MEEAVAELNDDDEEEGAGPKVEWAVLGKVLSPTTVHAPAIRGAMRLSWGNLLA
jgi:hypothetical protein